MSDETEVPGAGGHVPLPPEQPPAGGQGLSDAADAPPADAGTGEPAAPEPDAPPVEWWRGGDVRDKLREDWHTHSTEAAVAAQELGYQLQHAAGTISDAVASTAYPAAAKRGLDIRWMRLSINVPAMLIALLVTYGGRTATDRMVHTIATDGPFAPLGAALLFALVLGMVMVLPIGTPLAHALGNLLQWAAQGLVTVVRRAWQTPVVGYLMRLAIAVFVWSFIFAVLRVAGRSIIHWLTGA